MMKQIHQNKLCPTQEVFTKCIRSWLESPETILPDVSSVHESQCELLEKAISDQDCIGWHLAMRGYLSKYWSIAVVANQHLEAVNDKGVVLVHKTPFSNFGNSQEKCGSIGMQYCTTHNLSPLE
jgi:hypothetical protein